MDIDRSQKVAIAAANNADLYGAMFAAHGLRFDRKPHAFVGLDWPPPYYSNMTTLSGDATAAQMSEIMALARTFEGVIGLKDSFCRLDLTGAGFDVLFAADWVWRDPLHTTKINAEGWCRVETAADLARWETSWKRYGSPTQARMFPPALLEMPQMAFWGKHGDQGFEAGCVANVSAACIGLSNVFAAQLVAETYAEAALVAALLDPDKPLAGYQSGDDLQFMHDAGFQTVGKLQVWVAQAARF